MLYICKQITAVSDYMDLNLTPFSAPFDGENLWREVWTVKLYISSIQLYPPSSSMFELNMRNSGNNLYKIQNISEEDGG